MNEKNNKIVKIPPQSVWGRFVTEWKTFASILFRPIIFIPLIICGISLYFANTLDKQPLSLVLNLVAATLAGVASGGFWDSIKNLMGNTILIKKGSSAVRNLAVSRLKVKNIFERVNASALSEEIKNLATLLERDIANSIQEWKDVLPESVSTIEEAYVLLEEREIELNKTLLQKEDLNKRLDQEKQLREEDKKKLKEEIVEKGLRISELSQQIGKLKTTATSTSVITSGGYIPGSFGSSGVLFSGDYALMGALTRKCSLCEKDYRVRAIGESGKCPECEAKAKK